MKPFLFCLMAITIIGAGCKTNPRPMTPFAPGPPPPQQPSSRPATPQGAYVSVQGQVKNPSIPWTEDLTLAKALVLADYYGFSDPRVIMVIRGGVSYPVNPRELLQGRGDGPLEPGDVVVIR